MSDDYGMSVVNAEDGGRTSPPRLRTKTVCRANARPASPGRTWQLSKFRYNLSDLARPGVCSVRSILGGPARFLLELSLIR